MTWNDDTAALQDAAVAKQEVVTKINQKRLVSLENTNKPKVIMFHFNQQGCEIYYTWVCVCRRGNEQRLRAGPRTSPLSRPIGHQ